MASSILSSGKEAINSFIYDRLFPEITKTTADNKINLSRWFYEFLVCKGATKLLADEHTDKWKTLLLERIYEELSDWENIGLPYPIYLTNYSDTFITWKHPSYQEITGLKPLPSEFAALSNWIKGCDGTRFLFVCACFLKIIGADQIFVTDGSGDGGIDLIGCIGQGGLRSTMLCVQAKTSLTRISREAVLQEYGKFAALLRKVKFMEYQKALSLEKSVDGMSLSYIFISNNEFKYSARTIASDLSVLLRSQRQIAFWLAQKTTLAKLKQLEDMLGPLKRDLINNLASKISL